MTRFDFSPAFRTLLDFALLLRLVDGVEIAAMVGDEASKCNKSNIVQCVQMFVLAEIDEAAEARMHDGPEVRRLWISARSRCKAIEQHGQRTGRGGIDEFRCDERLSALWRDARVEGE